jgi:hypothetical protein
MVYVSVNRLSGEPARIMAVVPHPSSFVIPTDSRVMPSTEAGRTTLGVWVSDDDSGLWRG